MLGRIAPSYGSDITFASLPEYVLVSGEGLQSVYCWRNQVETGIKPPCLVIDGIHARGLEPKHWPATLFPFLEHTRAAMTVFHLYRSA